MMKKYIFFSILTTLVGFSSCVEDEGNNVLSEVNEIEISGMEDSYYKISGQETLNITPDIKSNLGKLDESNLEYEWFLCNNGVDSEHKHEVIGTERVLNYLVTANPSVYSLYLSVKDKNTGLKWEKSVSLNIISSFVRGFYLFGDKEDGTVGMDFVSMIQGRDKTIVTDILNNNLGIKGAEDLIFTGYGMNSSILWAITESGSYKVENSSAQTSFNFIEGSEKTEEFIFPTVSVTRPMKVVNVWPHAYGKSNMGPASVRRILCTENECYVGAFYDDNESYGNPMNRYSATSGTLFKPSKYLFYNLTSPSHVVLFDEDSHCFVRFGHNPLYYQTYANATYTIKLTNDGTPFYYDQNEYPVLRNLVYGENGYGNAGRSYALMLDEEGNYFVYLLSVKSSITPNAERTITTAATDFAQASHYAFYSMQPVVLYAVDSKLYAYDYYRHECKMINDFGSEITYLAMDYNSENDPNHIIVATYDNTNKGVVYGYTIEDNQNAINVSAVEGEEWHTDLKVVKVEYRNVAN